jgi:hypothetical protein
VPAFLFALPKVRPSAATCQRNTLKNAGKNSHSTVRRTIPKPSA